MVDAQRIEQFRKMANDDPDNELGHFSLGRALHDAGMHEDAIQALQRAIELNPNIGKVYQIMAQSLLHLTRKDDAIAMLTRGVEVADRRGDMLPRNEMTAALKELGAPVPEPKTVAPAADVGDGQVLCKRCGKPGSRLAKPPFRSDFGKAIYEGTCAACWREAIGMGTKVINELRLPMSDPAAQKMWDQHIREFLNL